MLINQTTIALEASRDKCKQNLYNCTLAMPSSKNYEEISAVIVQVVQTSKEECAAQ
jgi:hypothetical protein